MTVGHITVAVEAFWHHGEAMIRYTPRIEDQPGCRGALSFSSWDRPVSDSPEKHQDAIAAAVDNAKHVLARLSLGC